MWGCGNIAIEINTLTGIKDVVVELEHNKVSFEHTTEANLERVDKSPAKLGYLLLKEK